MEPDIYYNFTEANHCLTTLKNLELKVTMPSQLNDPFECLPSFKEPTRSSIEAMMATSKRRDFLLKHQFLEGRELNLWESNRRTQKSQRDFVNQVKRNFAKRRSDLKKTGGKVFDRFFFLCLTKNLHHLPTWSHYGDEHKGVAMGFRTGSSSNLFKIRYSSQRPQIDLFSFLSKKSTQAETRKMIFSKSEHWKSEAEYRMVFTPELCIRRGEIFFYKFDPKSIASIAFGARCSADHKDQIQQAIKRNPALHSVTLQEATLHKTKYGLEFQKRLPT